MESLKQKATDARLAVLDMVYRAQTSHIGSNFSVIDIFTVLFDKIDTTKDQVVLSAGWKAAAFYYFLADKGYFPKEKLTTYCQPGSDLIGLTEPGIPGVLFAGGSMQMGVPAAVGFALAKKIKGEDGHVYCIMSDGELAGGMIWESYLIAKHHKLDNLTFIIDHNGLQAMGESEKILTPELPEAPHDRIDGHNFELLNETLFQKNEEPTWIVCHTVKGYPISYMSGNNLYHYKNLSEEEYLKAKDELQNG